MEHTEAIETNASDRYVLRQLSAAEADAFEEHYFDCADCAEDVRLGMTIMEGGRRLVREADEPVEAPMAPVVPIDSRPRRGFRWIAAAAVAAMMAIPINLALLMRMQSAVPVAAFGAVSASVVLDTTRSSGQPPIVVSPNSTFAFEVPPPDLTRFSDYEARLVDPEGKVVSEGIFTEAEAANGRSLNIFDARPGKYQLLIFGTDPAGQSREVVRRDVIVKRAEKL